MNDEILDSIIAVHCSIGSSVASIVSASFQRLTLHSKETISSSCRDSSKRRLPTYISYIMTPKLHMSNAAEQTMVSVPLMAACTTSGAAYLRSGGSVVKTQRTFA